MPSCVSWTSPERKTSLEPPIVSSFGWLKSYVYSVSNRISPVNAFVSMGEDFARLLPVSQVKSANANGSAGLRLSGRRDRSRCCRTGSRRGRARLRRGRGRGRSGSRRLRGGAILEVREAAFQLSEPLQELSFALRRLAGAAAAGVASGLAAAGGADCPLPPSRPEAPGGRLRCREISFRLPKKTRSTTDCARPAAGRLEHSGGGIPALRLPASSSCEDSPSPVSVRTPRGGPTGAGGGDQIGRGVKTRSSSRATRSALREAPQENGDSGGDADGQRRGGEKEARRGSRRAPKRRPQLARPVVGTSGAILDSLICSRCAVSFRAAKEVRKTAERNAEEGRKGRKTFERERNDSASHR